MAIHLSEWPSSKNLQTIHIGEGVEQRKDPGRDPGARAQEYSLPARAQRGLRRGPGFAQAAVSPLAGMVQFPVRPNEGRGPGSAEQTG